MGYKEKVLNNIEKEELKKLWENIYNAYEQGGIESVKSTIDNQISDLRKKYQEVLKELEKRL